MEKGKIVNVLMVVYLCVLTLATGLCITAERYSLTQSALVRQGLVANSVTNLNDGTTSFNLVNGTGTVFGTYSIDSYASNGQIISVVLLKDTFEFPLLYPPREWQEIYLGETLVSTTESHLYLYALTAIWGMNLIITAYLWVKRGIVLTSLIS